MAECGLRDGDVLELIPDPEAGCPPDVHHDKALIGDKVTEELDRTKTHYETPTHLGVKVNLDTLRNLLKERGQASMSLEQIIQEIEKDGIVKRVDEDHFLVSKDKLRMQVDELREAVAAHE